MALFTRIDKFPMAQLRHAVGKETTNVTWTVDQMLGERNHFGEPTMSDAARKEPASAKRKFSDELLQIKHSWKPKN